MTPERLFERQLAFVFDRPITNPEWYFTNYFSEDDLELFDDRNPMLGFIFIENLLKNPKKHLENYSNNQIGLGLNYIFNNACSNLTFNLKDAEVDFERKKAVLSNLFLLFKDVLNDRCPPHTSAYEQVSISILNNFCYMFWDVTPLSHWSGMSKLELRAHYEVVAEVMQRCLSLKNPACVESGLHGLGHLVEVQPKMAQPIIDDFLAKNKQLNAKIKHYAAAARSGMIQ